MSGVKMGIKLLREYFRLKDEKGNGNVDEKEIKIFFEEISISHNMNVSNDSIDSLLKHLTKDQNGKISIEEFIDAVFPCGPDFLGRQ